MVKKQGGYVNKEVEKDLYDFWLKNKLFDPIKKSSKVKNFSIVLPPPNITGHLHLGHAWDESLQDCIIRYKKMSGYRTIFIPGTDHAGISTQTKYERILKEQGVDRNKISDSEFIKKLHTWATDQSKYIHGQWARLGLSLSYKHETFTLDKNVSELIIKEFSELYKKGLIYRANKLVNWDVSQKTAISDIEVIYKENKTNLWYIKYPVDGTKEFITIATTRPETMFGDTNIFVNPTDTRYKKFINKFAINPVNDKKMKILADSYIDKKFGTGAMKCTPAHDFNDNELARKHNITDYVSVINEDGLLNEYANTKYMKLAGVDRIKSRNEIIQNLKSRGFVKKIEEHLNKVGYSERTNEVVEPLLSLQWFVKMKPIVVETIKLMKNKPVNFLPPRFKKTLFQWLDNIQDWCISRQLLWGHKIPVWYNKKNGAVHVGNAPSNPIAYKQDTGVLDTWFSSGLWPLALTKYAKQKDVSDFYPVSMLVTGYDILFFWVARMLFQCSFIDKSVSLDSVLLHGLIRDEQGRKMSKSLGNGIDPIDVIERYGADSLRAFLISSSTAGEDVRYSEQKLQYIWSFINKIWNASNLITSNSKFDAKKINDLDAWIIKQLSNCVNKFIINMDKYNFVVAFKTLLDFAWETFCNKYLETSKVIKNSQTAQIASYVYKQILILFHAFSPFVTEYIYQKLYKDKKSIMLESISKIKSYSYDTALINNFLEIYSQVRNLRIKQGIKNATIIDINIIGNRKINVNNLNAMLSKININLNSVVSKETSSSHELLVCKTFSIEILNDFGKNKFDIVELQTKLKSLGDELARSKAILSNKSFIAKAPKEKVDLEIKKQKEYQEQYDQVKEMIGRNK